VVLVSKYLFSMGVAGYPNNILKGTRGDSG